MLMSRILSHLFRLLCIAACVVIVLYFLWENRINPVILSDTVEEQLEANILEEQHVLYEWYTVSDIEVFLWDFDNICEYADEPRANQEILCTNNPYCTSEFIEISNPPTGNTCARHEYSWCVEKKDPNKLLCLLSGGTYDNNPSCTACVCPEEKRFIPEKGGCVRW